MSYKVILTDHFKKEVKRLVKKYRSLKPELLELIETLEKNPKQGIHLGRNVFKIRLAIAAKGKGKKGGARVITYVQIDENTVLLLSIYSKGQKSFITDVEIRKILSQYLG